MRLFTLALVLTAVAFATGTLSGEVTGSASYTLPETDDLLDSYVFNEDELFSTIPAAFDDYVVVDDYTASSGESVIGYYRCWGLTTSSNPTELELFAVEDASGPSGAPFSMTSYPCVIINSGFIFAGYTVWMAEMDLSSYPILVFGGTTIWLGSHRNDGNTWYSACGTTVTGMNAHRTLAAGWAWHDIADSIEAGDLFKTLEDYVSLERTTWAGVKSSF